VSRLDRSWQQGCIALLITAASGCHEDQAVLLETPPAELVVGETRTVELRHLRFDVEGFRKEHSLADLQAMPRHVLEGVWLLDLDVRPLMINALEQLRTLPPSEVAQLPVAAQNMRRLLAMTPDNAVLDGTNLEELVTLSATVGIPPARALANLIDGEVTDDFIAPSTVAEVMLDGVIGSHPNAQTRRGPVDADHPDGLHPVAQYSIPLTLADVVTNFEDMAQRFGPVGDHPGFVLQAHGVTVIEEDFVMTSAVSANALPYKGVDLGIAEVASVNSIASQIETVHDFTDPDWMTLEGLVPEPRVQELTFSVVENPAFIPGGTRMEPVGRGDSPAWSLDPWEFEHLIVEMARRETATIPPHCDEYHLATGVAAFTACVDDIGWVTLETFNDVGSPPEPAYLWDLELEIAQVRLHDGGLAEGEANVELTVRDVAVGIPPEQLIEQVRENLAANPEALREFASLITSSTTGDADFYYVRVGNEPAMLDHGDWLFFVAEHDIRLDDAGQPVRPYAYASPGFFADESLTTKISGTREVDGDDSHEKLLVVPGDHFFVQDDRDRVFRIDVRDKPSRAWLRLDVTRVR
jgi:hypothetical protein